MCQLAGVSRASYYRHLGAAVPDEAEMAMRAAMQEIVLAHHRRYGYPKFVTGSSISTFMRCLRGASDAFAICPSEKCDVV